jgi:beta-lactamase class A
MDRRTLLLALPLGACARPLQRTAARTPAMDMGRLNAEIAGIAQRAAPGVLGVGLMYLDRGEVFVANGDRRFPMQSVSKMLLGAAALAEADAGRLRLDEVLTVEDADLSPPHSPIAEAWPKVRAYTAARLLIAAVGASDNTAADLLMRRIGGPGALTAWLQARRVPDVRVDRYERQLQTEMFGLASFRPAWRGEAAFVAALRSVPEPLRQAALVRNLTDPRDTATPRGMLMFLSKLAGGELLSAASTRLLLKIMLQTPAGPRRLKAGLPARALLAHKTGTSRTELGLNAATNDVGLITLPDQRRYALAAFLTGSILEDAARDALIADVARAAVRAVR